MKPRDQRLELKHWRIGGFVQIIEGINAAALIRRVQEATSTFEVSGECGIVLEPPRSKRWNDKISGALCAQRFELGDGGETRTGMISDVLALAILRKMIGAPPS